ncbi:hypothetical protein B0J14DRAFT_664166 [Halenospora varia]|nr:hypothetical protein B0J14DRAFT_664166 [Halenospora varia]
MVPKFRKGQGGAIVPQATTSAVPQLPSVDIGRPFGVLDLDPPLDSSVGGPSISNSTPAEQYDKYKETNDTTRSPLQERPQSIQWDPDQLLPIPAHEAMNRQSLPGNNLPSEKSHANTRDKLVRTIQALMETNKYTMSLGSSALTTPTQESIFSSKRNSGYFTPRSSIDSARPVTSSTPDRMDFNDPDKILTHDPSQDTSTPTHHSHSSSASSAGDYDEKTLTRKEISYRSVVGHLEYTALSSVMNYGEQNPSECSSPSELLPSPSYQSAIGGLIGTRIEGTQESGEESVTKSSKSSSPKDAQKDALREMYDWPSGCRNSDTSISPLELDPPSSMTMDFEANTRNDSNAFNNPTDSSEENNSYSEESCTLMSDLGLDGTESARSVRFRPMRMFSGLYTSSPPDMTRTTSDADVPQPQKSILTAPRLDQDIIREVVDLQRAALKENCSHPKQLKEIVAPLTMILEDEENADTATKFEDILHTRFDKLLEAILKTDYLKYDHAPEWWIGNEEATKTFNQELIPLAKRLQYKWQMTFKAAYLKIDDLRLQHMVRDGAMHHVEFSGINRNAGRTLFAVKLPYPVMKIANLLGEQGFKPGRWWLNAWCAYRDGIVGDPTQVITEGPSRVITALMLLSGTEVDGPVPGTYEYSIDGKVTDMKFNLLTQHGKPIRVLRGSQLKSKYAPEGGIRYDGLYTMDSHSHKIVNPHTNTYRLKLSLKRCGGQLPFEQLQVIPLPSQIDEWEMYNKLVDKDFRACYGDEADYASWKDSQEVEKKEKRVWLETQAFKDAQKNASPNYAGH